MEIVFRVLVSTKMATPLSFRIQGPSRAKSTLSSTFKPRNESDSEEEASDQLLSNFDRNTPKESVLHSSVLSHRRTDAVGDRSGKKPVKPQIIPSLPNKDWRKAAKDKQKERYIPDAVGSMRLNSTPTNGKEKTQGGMGTRDVINSIAVVGGLAVRSSVIPTSTPLQSGNADATTSTTTNLNEDQIMTPASPLPTLPAPPTVELTDEQKALRELLAGETKGEDEEMSDLVLLSAADDRGGPLDESDAFKRDLDSRPDEVSPLPLSSIPLAHPFDDFAGDARTVRRHTGGDIRTRSFTRNGLETRNAGFANRKSRTD